MIGKRLKKKNVTKNKIQNKCYSTTAAMKRNGWQYTERKQLPCKK